MNMMMKTRDMSTANLHDWRRLADAGGRFASDEDRRVGREQWADRFFGWGERVHCGEEAFEELEAWGGGVGDGFVGAVVDGYCCGHFGVYEELRTCVWTELLCGR